MTPKVNMFLLQFFTVFKVLLVMHIFMHDLVRYKIALSKEH